MTSYDNPDDLIPLWNDDEDDKAEETPEEKVQVAEAMLVLAEMARERGFTTIAQLGDLPPLDPETKAKYLARAMARDHRMPKVHTPPRDLGERSTP